MIDDTANPDEPAASYHPATIALASDLGTTAWDLLQQFNIASCVPAVCMACHLPYDEDLEPDARRVTCLDCGEDQVASIFHVEGLI